MSRIDRITALPTQRRASATVGPDAGPSMKRDSLRLSRRDGARPRSYSPTAECRDGTVSYSLNHSGTCSGHEGVAQWLDGSSPVVEPVPPPVLGVNPVPPPVYAPVPPPVYAPVPPPVVVPPVSAPIPYYGDDAAIAQGAVEMASAAVQNTTTYADQNSEVSQILTQAAGQVYTAQSYVQLADAAKADTSSYAVQDSLVESILSTGASRVSDVNGLIEMADAARNDTSSYSAQDALVEQLLNRAIDCATSSYDLSNIIQAAGRDTASYSTQNDIVSRATSRY